MLVDLQWQDGAYVARVDGVQHRLKVRQGPNGGVVVEIDGEAYQVAGTNGSTQLIGRDANVLMADLSARDAGVHRLQTGSMTAVAPENDSATKVVCSPLTGLVHDLRVEVGQTVETGQTLLVIEAMKMENRIAAACDGTVTSIAVANGQTVRIDAELLTIEPA